MNMSDLSALMGEDLATETFADIWVALPALSAAPLLGEARRLADMLGCYVHAVVTDEGLSEKAIAFGADRVHVADARDAVTHLAGQHPEFTFLPVALNAEAAQLAERLRGGLITDARNVSIDDGTRALLGSHPVYGGAYWQDVAVTSAAKVATLDARFLPEPYADSSRSGEILPGNGAGEAESKVRDLGPVDYTPQAWRPLTKAKTIVAVGRALKDAEGLALARQLAQALGAELAGERGARDLGWIDETHEVSVMNAEVAPEVYIALGIRGDTYHNAAIAGAKCVIAVHPEADAPIFKAADYGAVADPKEFAKELLSLLSC